MRAVMRPKPGLKMANAMTPSSPRQKSDPSCDFRTANGGLHRPTASNVITLDVKARTTKVVHPIGADASDEVLLHAIGRGDRAAVPLLYRRYHLRIYRFALRITRDATLAEDVVSSVFLDVWRRADGFKGKSGVSTWLLAITRHKSLTAVKRRCEDQLDGPPIEMADPADDPEVLVQKKDQGEVIRRRLWQLSAVQRQVIDLVYYHGKTIVEVAKIVGAPVGTVKTRMFHARRRLSAVLEAEHITL
jgi:RNA polymerase sigma-70 factor, ECF subfamily